MRELGFIYEEKAIHYLEKKNFKIIEKNYYVGHKEIDIICLKNNMIVFIEVKFRKRHGYFNPMSAISKLKIDNMVECARFFLQDNEQYSQYFGRFDGLFIIKNKNNDEEIMHIENINH